jgi:hypothetical protein
MRRLLLAMLVLGAASTAHAVDVPVVGRKLLVVDRQSALDKSKSKMVFVAKDMAVTKGLGTDPAKIEATLNVAYDGTSGAFFRGQGGNWFVNSTKAAKYVNKAAPAGGIVRVSVIKPGTLVKVVAKAALGISVAPTGTVYVADTIVNDGETIRLCTQFAGCVHEPIAYGYRLVCKGNSTGDPACTAAVLASNDGTVYDPATGLEWEKKTQTGGNGVNAADLHHVYNTYAWVGTCSVATSKHCQANAAAEAACKAQTDAAHWADGCEQCTAGEGTCVVNTVYAPAIITVWDWLSQVNATNFAGHNDWRLPSESGCNSCYTDLRCASCGAHELETILLSSSYPCGTNPCIAPMFGPTASTLYWSSSTSDSLGTAAWGVNFAYGEVLGSVKTDSHCVRAVRDAS